MKSFIIFHFTIPEKIQNETALNRIFERLSRSMKAEQEIQAEVVWDCLFVKNAAISQRNDNGKNRKNAGLEFIFNLHK